MPVRSILLAFALVLVLPASALAAGTLTVSISGAGGVSGSGIECTKRPASPSPGICSRAADGGRDAHRHARRGVPLRRLDRRLRRHRGRRARSTWPATATVAASFRDVQAPVVTLGRRSPGAVTGPMTITATSPTTA